MPDPIIPTPIIPQTVDSVGGSRPIVKSIIPTTVDSKQSNSILHQPQNAIYQEFDKYADYIKNIYPNDNWNRIAAQNQSGWEQFGNMFVQGVVGEILAQGVIGGVGGLAELPIGVVEEMMGKDADFSNFATRFADDISSSLRESNPIFQRNPSKSFDWTDSGYWFNNLVSVFSTVGLLVPARAGMKASSWISKSLKGAAELREASAAAKLAEGAVDVTKATLGSKTLRGVAAAFDTEKYWQNVAHSALAMRNAENLREASQVYNQLHDEAINVLADEDKYQEILSSKIGQEYIQETGQSDKAGLAKFIASKSAWKNYGMNYTNIIFDVIQLMPIARGLDKTTRTFIKPANVLKEQAKQLGTKATVGELGFAYTAPVAIGLTEQLGEGFEEAINAISQSDANWYGKFLLGEEKDETFNNRLKGYLNDSSTWEQAFWGAIGGVTFSAATRGISSIKDVIDDYKNPHSSDNRLEEIKSRELIINTVGADFKKIMDNKNPLTGSQFEGSETEIKQQQQDHFEMAVTKLADNLGSRAAYAQNVDLLLDMVAHPNFSQILVDKGIASESNVKEVVTKLGNRILASEKVFNSTYKSVFTSTQNEGIRRLIANNAVFRKSEIDGFANIRDKYESRATQELANTPVYTQILKDNPNANVQDALDNLIDTNVIDTIKSLSKYEKDNDVKRVLENKTDSVINKLTENIKKRTQDKITGDLSTLRNYIEYKTTARIYDMLAGKTTEKFIKETNPKTAVSEVESQIKTTTGKAKRTNFNKFKTKLDTDSKVETTDTHTTITEKIQKLQQIKTEINEQKIDSNIDSKDPLRKLDSEYVKLYNDAIDNRLKKLQSELQRISNKENIEAEIETKNKDIITNLNKILSRTTTNPNLSFTGKRSVKHEDAFKQYLSLPFNEATGERVSDVLGSAVAGQTSYFDDAVAILSNPNLKDFYIKSQQNNLEEEFVNELLLALGYVADVAITPKSSIIQNLEKFNSITNDTITIEIIQDLDKLTKQNQILETPVGTFITLDSAGKKVNFDTIEQAKAYIQNNNKVKPVIDFTQENRVSQSDLELANSIITELLNVNGEQIIKDINKNGSKKKVVSIPFDIVAQQYCSRTDEETARKWYPVLKRAYNLVVASNTDSRYKFTSHKIVNKTTIDTIYSKYEIKNQDIAYEFKSEKFLESTGGVDAINIWLFDLLELGKERDEEGNPIVSADKVDQIETILTGLDSDTKVRLRVDTEYKQGKEFKLNKNNLLQIPIKVEVESKKEKGKYIKIGALNKLPMNHDGVQYNFKGNDWTDVILSPYDDKTNNRSLSNFRLQLLSDLYPQLREWYILNRRSKISKDESLKMLEEIANNDTYKLLEELTGKDITTTEGQQALKHILNIIFFGDNYQSNPGEFNLAKVAERINNWKDKLYRDYTNGLKIRTLINNDPNVVLETNIVHKTSGNITKALDKDGKPIYKNIRTLGNIKLFRLQKSSSGTTLANVKNPKEVLNSKVGGFKHTFFIGIDTKTTKGIQTIPVPVERNTLDGSVLESSNSNELINNVFTIMQDYAESKYQMKYKESSNKDEQGNAIKTTRSVEDLQAEQVILEKRLSDYVMLKGEKKDERVEDTDYYITHNFEEFRFNYQDEKGINKTIIYNYFSKQPREERKEGNVTEQFTLTNEQFKQRLGKLRRNINYESLNKPFNGYKTYQDYLIDTNSIVTDIGWVKSSDGRKISNISSSTDYNNGGMPLIINLNTKNLNKQSSNITTFAQFKNTFDIDNRFDFVLSVFNTLLDQSKTNFGGVTDSRKNMYAYVDPITNTIYITKKWVDLYNRDKSHSKVYSTLLVMHEILHSFVGTLSMEQQTKLLNDLTTFNNTIKESNEYKNLATKSNKTDIDNKILDILDMDSVEELLTYGLTDLDFAKFLDTIKTDVEQKQSAWNRFKEIIRELLQTIGVTTSKLDELNNLFITYFDNNQQNNNSETGLTASDLGIESDLFKELQDFSEDESFEDLDFRPAIYSSSVQYNENPVINEEIRQGFRDFTYGKRKLYQKNDENYKKLLKLVQDYNNKNTSFNANVINISNSNGTASYAVALKAKIEYQQFNITELMQSGIVKYVDETTGEPCAEFGFTNTLVGSKWSVVKDFKGKPSHEQGGVNITIEDTGVHINTKDSKVHAKNGLVLEYEPSKEESNENSSDKSVNLRYVIPTKLRRNMVTVNIDGKEQRMKVTDAQRELRNKILTVNNLLNQL